jgi:hypothetical protein
MDTFTSIFRLEENKILLCIIYIEINIFNHYGYKFHLIISKKKKNVGLERGPLSLVSTTEELLERKVPAPV